MAKEHIFKLAKSLDKQGSFMTRADLAYNLDKFGYGKDSIEITRLVWESWLEHKKDDRILKVFIGNDGVGSLVESFQLHNLVENNDVDAFMEFAQNALIECNDALTELEDELNSVLEKTISTVNKSGILGKVSGTSGVKAVQNEVTTIFDSMSDAKNAYDIACDDVRNVVDVFIELREGVNEIFMKYSLLLSDIFGDSIKTVAPEYFDFNAIEYLDVQGLYSAIELEYNNLSTSCSTLMNSIRESFTNALSNSVTAYKTNGDKTVALAMAGLNLVSHYLNASEQTLILGQELQKFKSLVRKDVTTIKGDMVRLFSIYRLLNEVLIPKSDAFYRYSNGVLMSSMQQISDLFYSDPAIKELALERDALLNDMKELNRTMLDNQTTISYYKSALAECNEMLKVNEGQYNNAKANKPSKPNALLNLITFGSSKKNYNRSIYEWNMACAPIITSYESMAAEAQLYTKEIATLQSDYEADRNRIITLKSKLTKLSKRISKLVNNQDAIKAQLVKVLKDVFGLLKVGKEILNSGLNDKMLKAVSVEQTDFSLPEKTVQELDKFTDKIKKVTIQHTDDEIEAELMLKAEEFMKHWALMQQMKSLDRQEAEHYEKELSRISDSFSSDFKDIDNKGKALRSVLAKLNLSMSPEDIKSALLMLSDSAGVIISEDELNQFISGDKIIEI
jgi:predicted  nucleic acid-binding Zn-ribbon protein